MAAMSHNLYRLAYEYMPEIPEGFVAIITDSGYYGGKPYWRFWLVYKEDVDNLLARYRGTTYVSPFDGKVK